MFQLEITKIFLFEHDIALYVIVFIITYFMFGDFAYLVKQIAALFIPRPVDKDNDCHWVDAFVSLFPGALITNMD